VTDSTGRLRIAAALALGIVLAASMVGCIAEPAPTERVRPTPTPGPPSIRPASGSSTFDGRIWTLHVVVEPKGEPTDVVIEWGTGTETGPFDHLIPMAEDVVDIGQVSIQTTELPADFAYCIRFTATNSFGTASTPARCFPGIPSGWPPPGATPTP
jgi:hypothetical protein